MIRIVSKIALVAAVMLGGMIPNTLADDDVNVSLAIPAIKVVMTELPAPVYVNPEDLRCMVQNLYHEARDQDIVGVVGVGWVVLNRVASKKYPNTVCKVVQQGGERRRYRCQFSWWCDGKSDKMKEQEAKEALTVIARALLLGELKDPTHGALNYHADYVQPYWMVSPKLKRTIKLGVHIFYKPNKA